MKFLANENFPIASVVILRAKGFDVLSVGESNPSVEDEEVIRISIEQDRTILTFDRDYGELVFKFGHKPSAGVIYFRIESFTPTQPARWVISLLEKTDFEVNGMFTVYELDNTRQRKI